MARQGKNESGPGGVHGGAGVGVHVGDGGGLGDGVGVPGVDGNDGRAALGEVQAADLVIAVVGVGPFVAWWPGQDR